MESKIFRLNSRWRWIIMLPDRSGRDMVFAESPRHGYKSATDCESNMMWFIESVKRERLDVVIVG